ncbi:MAG: hypothetical protein RLZZ436_2685 [Planctomycetota bacterium]
MKTRRLLCVLLLCIAAIPCPALRAQESAAEKTFFFESKIRPLLVEHCYECHSQQSNSIKGGLSLDTRQAVAAGGDSGKVLIPGKPEESLLLQSVRYDNPDLQMPPKGRLADSQIADLERWIRMGAPDPREGTAVPRTNAWDRQRGRSHWAFQHIHAPPVPATRNPDWPRSDIDRLLLARLESSGITPAPDTSRELLLRRVTLDLIGLPPTPAEQSEFLKDTASDDEALARVVDRLLAAPAFGERWGRHWLDVVRYADSVGKTRNIPFPYAWRYRNYVIDAFNTDKPFDDFIEEQIAGDLLPSRSARDRAEQLVATGFLALGSMDLNERDTEQFKLDQIDDQLDAIGRGMLGLTLSCARCHDHKFDPISQADYYALAGILASTQTLTGQLNRQGGNQTYFHPERLLDLKAAAKQPAPNPSDSAPSAARLAQLRQQLNTLVRESKSADLPAPRQKVVRSQIATLRRELAAATPKVPTGAPAPTAPKKSQTKQQRIEEVPFDPKAELAMAAAEGVPRDIELRLRGEPDLKGDVVPRSIPVALRTAGNPRMPENGSGRLELAQWLTSSRNPLTARVMVNRVWSHLFGRGLVDSVDNFGLSGSIPEHPELLDHLAAAFIKDDWSVKQLIRRIVLSRVYRLRTEHSAEDLRRDEGNVHFGRANLRRLEAEIVRDSLLAISGQLDRGRPTGAPFDPAFTGDLTRAGRGSAEVQKAFARPIRSIYLPVFRSEIPQMFSVFDFAEPDQVNGLRDVTTVPPQALFMLNNPFVIDASDRIAGQLLEGSPGDQAALVRQVWRRVYCRTPTPIESTTAIAFLKSNPGEPHKQLAALVQSTFASAEFRYRP